MAQIFVALMVANQEGIAGTVLTENFCAGMWFESGLLHGEIKAWRTVDTVEIEQRHGWNFEVDGGGGEFFREGGTLEKAKRRSGVKLAIHSPFLRLCNCTLAEGNCGLSNFY